MPVSRLWRRVTPSSWLTGVSLILFASPLCAACKLSQNDVLLSVLHLLPYQPAARRPISPRVIFCGLFPRKGASGCTPSRTPRKEGGSGKTGGALPSMYSFIQHTHIRPFPNRFT